MSSALEGLLDFLRTERGLDFTGYKRPSLERRVRLRMSEVGVDSLEEYRDFLEAHPGEFSALFNTILVNVTGFFRDPEAWALVGEEIVPAILAGKSPGAPIRVWSAGCASGEEAYSLAIVFHEAIGTGPFRDRVKIYATDIDDDAVAVARRGEYPARDLRGLSPERADRYFPTAGGARRVFRADLRRCIVFGRHDLTTDTPISSVDLLACRNTLIYLNTETQDRVISRFHYSLAPGGHLFLGRSEALVRYDDLFETVDLRARVFRKVTGARGLTVAEMGAPFTGGVRPNPGPVEVADEISQVAQALVDSGGRLAAANGACRALFGLGPQDIGRPFDEVGLFRLPVDLREAVRGALAESRSFGVFDVVWEAPPADLRRFEVRVLPLTDDGGAVTLVSVTFLDVTRTLGLAQEAFAARENLATAMAELQTANEELETTNEELQSTNEELETTNEELQSTNEELETMNEELQSAGDQLDTLNRELRGRSSELDEVNGFLQSVLGSVLVSVIALDAGLVVTSWNHAAEQLWGLWAGEAVGRSFLALDIGMPMDRLRGPLLACLEGTSEREELTLPATNRRGREIQCRVTVTRLSGTDALPKGLVVMLQEVPAAAPTEAPAGG